MVLYGQIVIGAPGSGKTTYCDGMQQYLNLLGRDCHVINLDPANEVPPTPDGDDDGNGATTTATTTATTSATTALPRGEEEDDGREMTAGNTQLPYDAILDVCEDVIGLDSVMSELGLGPNGGLLYCMEYLEHHLGGVIRLLKDRLGIGGSNSRPYLLFDLPGQIELTAHSNVISRIAQRLSRELDLRLVCVQLVDAAVCLTDVSKFIGAALVCTASMMRLELPFVNVLSKMDLLQTTSGFGGGGGGGGSAGEMEVGDHDVEGGYDDGYDVSSPLPFNLEYFTQCHDLRRLVDYLGSDPTDYVAGCGGGSNDIADPSFDYMEDTEYRRARERTRTSNFNRKYRKLHVELCDMVEDYSLLSFLPLSIQDAESVGRVVARVDKCNGYVFLKNENDDVSSARTAGGASGNNDMQRMFSSAIVADSEWSTGVLSDVQERYLGDVMFREKIPELCERRGRSIGERRGGL